MGLFGKDKGGTTGTGKDLAKIIAKRGAPGEATITTMTPIGQTRGGGEGKEIEFRLRLEVAGAIHEPVVRQYMNDLTLTGQPPTSGEMSTGDR